MERTHAIAAACAAELSACDVEISGGSNLGRQSWGLVHGRGPMDDLPWLVSAAQRGDLDAFAALVGRYQDLAFATAYARLGDVHLAQDAAQEAFLQVHRDLPMLREPSAFPSWLRRIVAKHADRLVRGKRVRTVALDAAIERWMGSDPFWSTLRGRRGPLLPRARCSRWESRRSTCSRHCHAVALSV